MTEEKFAYWCDVYRTYLEGMYGALVDGLDARGVVTARRIGYADFCRYVYTRTSDPEKYPRHLEEAKEVPRRGKPS